ncbi:arrestin domain-containing protein 2-like [Lineus longissimus]|uniref:arrestin domain-containing protein 2-like n=1 Tax=Lineus longissimus TaxID=88925 RepID=UPI002B4F5E1D
MGKVNILEITLSRRHGSYLPGEYVDGYVTMEILEELNVRGISIEAKGTDYVRITEGTGRHRKVYLEKTEIIHEKIQLYTPASQGKMPPNRYTYPFRFHLNSHMAMKTSMESEYAHVRYKLKCSVDIPMGFDHEVTKFFTVTTPVDLNQCYTAAREPVEMSKDGTFCCLCCATPKVTCEFRLDKGVYVCGEAVKVTGTVTNPSNRILKASVMFKRKVKCNITGHKESEENELTCQDFGIIPAGQTVQLDDTIQVPPCAPQSPSPDSPMFTYCQFFYHVEIWVDPIGLCTGLPIIIELPFNVGTIPVPGNFNLYQRKQLSGSAAITEQPVPMQTMYGGMQPIPPVSLVPLPFFQKQYKLEHRKAGEEKEETQAVQGPVDVDELGEFHPSYPFYSWDNIYFTLGFGEAIEGEAAEPGCVVKSVPAPLYPPVGAPPGQTMMAPGVDPNQPPLCYPVLQDKFSVGESVQ